MNPQDGYAPRAWLLDRRGGARRLDRGAGGRRQPEDGPSWIALDADSELDRAWLGTEEGVGWDNRELFLRESVWPRVRSPGPEQLVLVTRVIHPDPEAPPGTHVMLRFWIEPQRVISMAPKGLPYLQELETRLEMGRGPISAGTILLALIESLANQLADAVLKLRPEVVELDLALEQEEPPTANQIRQLRRRAIDWQRYADPQRTQLLRLRSLELSWLTDDHGDDWRAVIDYYSEGSRELDAVVDRARILEDALANRTSEQMNRRIYLLTLMATLVLPLTLITSLLAVSVSTIEGNILGTHHPGWFAALCVGLVLVGLGSYLFFRRRGLT